MTKDELQKKIKACRQLFTSSVNRETKCFQQIKEAKEQIDRERDLQHSLYVQETKLVKELNEMGFYEV